MILTNLEDTQLSCYVCGSTENIRIPTSEKLEGHTNLICVDCFCVWYDTGETDPQKIKELSLQRQNRAIAIHEKP